MNIKTKGLAHIGIPTSDLEHSIAFYKSLGFKWKEIISFLWSVVA